MHLYLLQPIQLLPSSHIPLRQCVAIAAIASQRSEENEEGEKGAEQRLCRMAGNCVSFLLQAPVTKLEQRLRVASAMAVRKVVDAVEKA